MGKDMTKKLVSVVLCVLFAIGCCTHGPDNPASGGDKVVVTMHADSSFTQEDRQNIDFAAKEWSRESKGLVAFNIIYDLEPGQEEERAKNKEHILLRLTSKEASDAEVPDEVLGWVSPPGGSVASNSAVMVLVVDRAVSSKHAKAIIMHELGHMVGMSHTMPKNSMLYPVSFPDKEPCLTHADESEYCRVNYCGSVHFEVCK